MPRAKQCLAKDIRVKDKEWKVYMVRCADGSLYTGITTDMEKRITKHNQGTASKYTRSRRPVVLAWKEGMDSESAARRREMQIKGLTRTEKLSLIEAKNLIRRNQRKPR